MALLFVLAVIAAVIWLGVWLSPDRAYGYSENLCVAEMSGVGEDVPTITAIVPARNEAESLPRTLPSLLTQDYPRLTVVLVDDHSTDHTADVAQQLYADLPQPKADLHIVNGQELPPGWAGKMWALAQGVPQAQGEWLLFTDADIQYPPRMVSALASCARQNHRDMVSLMAQLSTRFFWEKLLIPAFLYFFKLLYPFHAVNDSRRKVAAAAGGCILIRRETLETAGGIAAVHDALIDDIALARAVKGRERAIMLLTAPELVSTREYATLQEIWRMVTRSAFTELHYSYLRLCGCVLAMSIAFAVPLLGLLVSLCGLSMGESGWLVVATGVAAASAYGLICLTYAPTIRHFRLPRFWAATLPLAAMLYLAMTLDSARRYALGVRSAWKGRNYGVKG